MAARAGKDAGSKGTASFDAILDRIGGGDIRPVYVLYGEEAFLQERFLMRLSDAWLGKDADVRAVERLDGKAMSQAQAVDAACQMTLLSDRRLVVVDEPVFVPCGKAQETGKSGSRGTGDQADDADADDPDADGADGVDRADGAVGADRADGAGSAVSTGAADGTIDAGSTRAPKKAAGTPAVATGTQPLLTYLSQPSSDVCLVLRVRKGKPDRRQKLVSEIAKAGGLVEAAPLSAQDRIPYLQEAMRDMGKQCPPPLLARIARQSGGLAFCMREAEKLVAYAGDETTITSAMLDAVLTPNLESNIFSLVDALGQRRHAEALRELSALLDNGEPPFVVFAMIVRQFRLIFRAKACLQDGLGSGQIAQTLGIHPYTAKNVAAQCRYYTFPALERATALFCETDLSLKSNGAGEYRRILTDLLIRLGSDQAR